MNGEGDRPAKRPREEEEPGDYLEPSFFGVAPHDSFVREVGLFIWKHAQGAENVEVEAKMGLLVEKDTPKDLPAMRIDFPSATECILTDNSRCRFESNMTAAQHASLNKLLNARTEETQHADYPSKHIGYKHLYELDSFFETPAGRVRLTHSLSKDRKTKTVKPGGCIIKKRIADMDVYWRREAFDFRISVSTETPAGPPENEPDYTRFKDRLSYEHQIIQVDLTKVEPTGSKHPEPPRHEIEVEFINIKELLAEATKEMGQAEPQPNCYFEMVAVMINTIRMLIKNSSVYAQ